MELMKLIEECGQYEILPTSRDSEDTHSEDNIHQVLISEDTVELSYVALLNFIIACERQHFSTLVFKFPQKVGIHLFCVLPLSKQGIGDTICGDSQHKTLYSFIENYKPILELAKDKEELETNFNPNEMAIVGFRFPLETYDKNYGYSMLNIHLYDIKRRKRITNIKDLEVSYLEDGITE